MSRRSLLRGWTGEGKPLELDYMEYPTEALATTTWGSIDTDTKLLISFDGAKGATSHTAVTGQVLTFVGQAHLDDHKKFGATSLYLDGNGDTVTLLGSSDFEFGSGNFTVDFWAYLTSSARQYFFGPGTDASTHYGFGFDYNSVGTGKLGVFVSSNGSSWDMINADGGGNGICATTVPLNQWNHIAIDRNGNNWQVFLNGVSDLNITVAGTIFDRSGVIYRIGSCGYGGGVLWLNGWIDEFRISKGVARWTSAFTPPTAPTSPIVIQPEASIKTQGSFSLKAVAPLGGLNQTLSRTFTALDFVDAKYIKFDIRSSRTGSNIKFGIRSSGTNSYTAEIIPSIVSANTWQTVLWDISQVPDIYRSGIVKIIITIVNADAVNTFYVDNMYAVAKESTKVVSPVGFVASGGTKTTDGAHTVHTFTTSGVLSATGTTTTAEVLIVGGGGGGGGRHSGGGGGGGVVYIPAATLNTGDYAVTIGEGGAVSNDGGLGHNGGDTIFSGNGCIETAKGGGGGGIYPTPTTGNNGGSGGGGGSNSGASIGGAASQLVTNNFGTATGFAFAGGGGVGGCGGDARGTL